MVEKLRPNQRKAIQHLAAGGTIETAAATAGVTERTLYNWRSQTEFKKALNDASEQMLETAMHKLTDSAMNAVRVLNTIANDKDVKASTRVSAAKALLEHLLKIRELHSLEQRIAALEESLEYAHGE